MENKITLVTDAQGNAVIKAVKTTVGITLDTGCFNINEMAEVKTGETTHTLPHGTFSYGPEGLATATPGQTTNNDLKALNQAFMASFLAIYEPYRQALSVLRKAEDANEF